MNDPEFNPFAAPRTVDFEPINTTDESLRKQYIAHEASVKSVGLLFFIGAVINILMPLLLLSDGGSKTMPIFTALLLILLGAVQFWVGIGLRRLTKIARIFATIFAAIGLIWVPVGTVIGMYLLYLFWCGAGQVVFSEQYKGLIRRTPRVKNKTSNGMMMLLLVVLLGLLAVGISIFTVRRF